MSAIATAHWAARLSQVQSGFPTERKKTKSEYYFSVLVPESGSKDHMESMNV
jgi:hypothetical protein